MDQRISDYLDKVRFAYLESTFKSCKYDGLLHRRVLVSINRFTVFNQGADAD